MADIMDKGLEVFIEECAELLQEMESSLEELRDTPNDDELINSLFRSAHTIKGSSGLFGLDNIVDFTHRVENVLTGVRSGQTKLTTGLINQLMLCKDHTETLVENIGKDDNDPEQESYGQKLLSKLEQLANPMAENGNKAIEQWLDIEKLTTEVDADELGDASVDIESETKLSVATDFWHISLRFDQDVLRNGMDPLSLIQYLSTLGKIIDVVTLTDSIPRADKMDPESCYLGMEIRFDSDTDKQTITDVFQFISEDSQVWILPPHSKISEYSALIEDLKETDDIDRIGQLLIQTNTLSERELQQALKLQQEQNEISEEEPAPPIGEILIEQKAIHLETVNQALNKQKQVKDSKLRESKFIRVDADHLDQLVDAVGELVIASEGNNMLAQQFENSVLTESASTVSHLVEEIRDRALSLRMVQIGDTFKRFNRIVRDISTEIGKEIKLNISGSETELDKSVVEKIGDPLTHLIRNSIDHGIEPSEDRIAANKPVHGTVFLNAFHDSGFIVIQVRDDGKGIDKDNILAKAIEKGLVTSEQKMSEQEILQLIMHPGLSTKEQVSTLSGRGVGMDVVKRNVEALRGSIVIESELGQGTVISLRMPLTLSIISGLLVGVGKRRYVLPLDSVIECVELPENKDRGQHEGDYINLRDQPLPYIDLGEQFNQEISNNNRKNIVVVKHNNKLSGLVVDTLLGEYQTVIKPLNKIFAELAGISGSTILGDGEVALILDIPALVNMAK